MQRWSANREQEVRCARCADSPHQAKRENAMTRRFRRVGPFVAVVASAEVILAAVLGGCGGRHPTGPVGQRRPMPAQTRPQPFPSDSIWAGMDRTPADMSHETCRFRACNELFGQGRCQEVWPAAARRYDDYRMKVSGARTIDEAPFDYAANVRIQRETCDEMLGKDAWPRIVKRADELCDEILPGEPCEDPLATREAEQPEAQPPGG